MQLLIKQKIITSFLLVFIQLQLIAQTHIWAATEFSKSTIDSVLASGAGISGAGKPVQGSFFGGHAGNWNSDVDVTPENRNQFANGSSVSNGFIPNIKPIWDVNMRDAVIIIGGDGNYYMTGSTGRNIWRYNDGVEIYRSNDLKKWDYLGLVWSIERDGGWEKQWRLHHGKPIRSVWAPELHYIHKNYYICLSMPPGGISILKSTTGKPEGPYTHATNPNKPLMGGIGPIPASFLIDPTLFEDEDGKVYFTQGPANFIVQMKDDLSDFAEQPHLIQITLPDTCINHHIKNCIANYKCNDLGFEGATLFKRNGIYYLGSTDKFEGRYSMMIATSTNIYGPYASRYEAVPCNGGTNFFRAKNGDWFTCFFGDDKQAPWREKPGIIKIEFDRTGKISVAKNQPDFILTK
jgi:hypothetical protein